MNNANTKPTASDIAIELSLLDSMLRAAYKAVLGVPKGQWDVELAKAVFDLEDRIDELEKLL